MIRNNESPDFYKEPVEEEEEDTSSYADSQPHNQKHAVFKA
jgi:hypothetical protein